MHNKIAAFRRFCLPLRMIMNGQRSMTLLELNSLVRQTIELTMPNEYWVEAELSELRESRGHCYMELIQKAERSNTPVARASAKCWQSVWNMVKPYFERTTGQRLHAGMKVLLRVYPQFHEAYGFSWIVSDIDPTYTLGDMARKRQEIIRKLKEEGVFDLNRELSLPLFCQRIAVVSSETAAGYGDFCNQLADNEYGFRFTTRLFPAVMQGERVEESVIAALDRINSEVDSFDCVVIIRGGGATSDMSGFDTLALAENVTNFPLPVITGIGHDRDECILDMVSHTRVKTPTAAAAFLITHLQTVYDFIVDCHERIVDIVSDRIERENRRIERLSERIPALFSVVKVNRERHLDRCHDRMLSAIGSHLAVQAHRVDILSRSIAPSAERLMTRETHRLDMLAQRTKALDPAILLRRGYSITMKDGKAVRSVSDLKTGDRIETRVMDGSVKSTVT